MDNTIAVTVTVLPVQLQLEEMGNLVPGMTNFVPEIANPEAKTVKIEIRINLVAHMPNSTLEIDNLADQSGKAESDR
uniref:Acriflavin resistance protein n=1 Tax=Globodera pallida TaxID=36090 RepID=A0A183CQV0_GLOPA